MNRKKVGELFLYARKNHFKVDQIKMGKLLCASQSQISKVESGIAYPNVEVLITFINMIDECNTWDRLSEKLKLNKEELKNDK